MSPAKVQTRTTHFGVNHNNHETGSQPASQPAAGQATRQPGMGNPTGSQLGGKTANQPDSENISQEAR